MSVALCPVCQREQPARHLHDEAFGVAGTHMAGTERYECAVCGHVYPREAAEALGLEYAADLVVVTDTPVPCGGCNLCCRNDSVRILPHEDAGAWLTEPHPYQPGQLMLAHKPNRDCIYLGDRDGGGCTIWARRPQQCRAFDCRDLARKLTWGQLKQLHVPIRIWRRGKELLEK